MRIIDEEQLDFDDVLIMPRRSSISSRSDVNIYRTFEFNNTDSGHDMIHGIPVVCANMGSVSTPETAKIFTKNGFFCALEKHIDLEGLCKLYYDLEKMAYEDGYNQFEYSQRVFPSIGIKESTDILENFRKHVESRLLRGINIDVPNGYVPQLIDRVKLVKEIFPNAFIIAGTVVTPDICQDLINAGANCIRGGIGGGCFWGDCIVKTSTGEKPIKDIMIGDKVLTHSGTFEEVTNKFEFNDHKEIITVNGINCTPEHKFYVARIEDIPKITEENYKDYCIWIEAKDLDPDKYELVEIANTKIKFHEIEKSEIRENTQKTYDLEVGNSHSYNINGIIVHNSVCITRLKTGCGRPQFSTVVECADACHQMGAFFMSDGGCRTPGDICKAFCAGADMVMCGGIFAGADETESETRIVNGKSYRQFYGMSSKLAQEKFFGGMPSYRASEGREKWVPSTGPLKDTIDDICGGLRSCGTYIGAKKIKNFSRQAAFYKVRRQLNEKFAGCEDISD